MKHSLEIAYHIPEIGAASGIFLSGNRIYLVSDNGSFLFVYNTEKETLEKIIIFEIEVPGQIAKHLKADFEALAYYNNRLYIFGSGSTSRRNRLVIVDVKSGKVVSSTSLEQLYLKMQQYSGIDNLNFNIEGAACNGVNWYFLQRGNGPSAQNGMFVVVGDMFQQQPDITYHEFLLPQISGVSATFTDALIVGSKLYFVACAEDSNSVYEDGEILGSLIGCIDLNSLQVDFTQTISNKHKFEGITLSEITESGIEFLLCEDNDSEILESAIYKLTIEFKTSVNN